MEGFPERALSTKPTPEYSDRRSAPIAERVWRKASGGQVVFMSKVSGMSLKEIAQPISSTVGAVKQKARRGYQTLRRVIGDDFNGSGKRNELHSMASH